MSTSKYEEKTIVLMDGTEIKVRPLKISLLRPFMKKFEKIADVAEDNEKSINALLECIEIAMQQYNPDLADIKKLEEIMDLPTVYAIVEAASGVNLTAVSDLLQN